MSGENFELPSALVVVVYQSSSSPKLLAIPRVYTKSQQTEIASVNGD